jgi:hypothetical protein
VSKPAELFLCTTIKTYYNSPDKLSMFDAGFSTASGANKDQGGWV